MIDLDRIAVAQLDVSGNDVTEPQADEVARDQLAGRDRRPGAVALDLGRQGQLLLERRDRVAGLELFPESDDGVHHEQDQDDTEVHPVSDNQREDRGRLDHPGDRSPERGEELEERVLTLLRKFVGTILGEALPRFVVAETVWRSPEPPLEVGKGQFRQVLGLGKRHRCPSNCVIIIRVPPRSLLTCTSTVSPGRPLMCAPH